MHRVIFSTFFYRSGWHFKMFSREVANKNTQISRRLGKEQRCHARKRQERTASNIVFTSMLMSRNYLPPLFRIWSTVKEISCTEAGNSKWSTNVFRIWNCTIRMRKRCLWKMKVCICIQQLHCGQSFSPLTRWHDSNMQRFRERAAKFNNRKWIMIKKCQKTKNSPTFTDCWTRWTLTWALRHLLLIVLTRQELLFYSSLSITSQISELLTIGSEGDAWMDTRVLSSPGWKINFTSWTIKATFSCNV